MDGYNYRRVGPQDVVHTVGKGVGGSNQCGPAGKACAICCSCCSVVCLVLAVALAMCAMHPNSSNVTPAFIDSELGGDPVFAWWSLAAPQPPSLLAELRGELVDTEAISPGPMGAILGYGPGVANLTFGFAPAARGADLMYRATKVEGVWEQVPEKLRGVFWMRGNGVPEELTVLQYGRWSPESQVYIVPMAPFMWAWAGGTPKDAPFGGKMYGPNTTLAGALVLTNDGKPGVAFSFRFGACPRGAACPEGSDDLSYADLQAHAKADLNAASVDLHTLVPPTPPIFTYATGRFALEEMPNGPQPGSMWKRRIHWGVGGCTDLLEFGSYDLVKVIDGSGAPLEPFYSEFINYMGDVPLYLWSGFAEGTGEPPS